MKPKQLFDDAVLSRVGLRLYADLLREHHNLLKANSTKKRKLRALRGEVKFLRTNCQRDADAWLQRGHDNLDTLLRARANLQHERSSVVLAVLVVLNTVLLILNVFTS